MKQKGYIDNELWIIGALLALCLAGTVSLLFVEHVDYQQFMAECLKDHKQYECSAMYRAGQSTIQPMPIIIPMGR